MASKTSLKTDSKRKLVESAYIQHLCLKNDFEMICFDEFSLSARHTSLYDGPRQDQRDMSHKIPSRFE